MIFKSSAGFLLLLASIVWKEKEERVLFTTNLVQDPFDQASLPEFFFWMRFFIVRKETKREEKPSCRPTSRKSSGRAAALSNSLLEKFSHRPTSQLRICFSQFKN